MESMTRFQFIGKLGLHILMLLVVIAAMSIPTYAAFTAQAKLTGISFTTGRAELKIFGNPGYTHVWNNGNLTPVLPGWNFEGIGPFWQGQFALKYFNTGTVNLNTTLRVTPKPGFSELADYILIETWQWDDTNRNGKVDETDSTILIAAAQPLADLQTSPINLGQLNVHQPRGLLFKFSTEDLPPQTQNQKLPFDFLIDGTTQDADQT